MNEFQLLQHPDQISRNLIDSQKLQQHLPEVGVAVIINVVCSSSESFTTVTMPRLSLDFQWAMNHIHSYIHNYITKIKYTRQNNI